MEKMLISKNYTAATNENLSTHQVQDKRQLNWITLLNYKKAMEGKKHKYDVMKIYYRTQCIAMLNTHNP